MSELVRVETPDGPGELVLAEAARPLAAVVLGHGAGGSEAAWDLELLARELPASGISVARYRQPWLVAGRKVAGPPASLDRAWPPALAVLRRRWPGVPLFVGGRSAGARCACRCYDASLAGLVLLSFPLHPPGKPAKSPGLGAGRRRRSRPGAAGCGRPVRHAGGPGDRPGRRRLRGGADRARPGRHPLAGAGEEPAGTEGGRARAAAGGPVLTFIADALDPVPSTE